MHRKSDGEDIAQYRDDAYGRRVHAESWWELSRRVYLDTRFELDVDLDWDNDTVELEIVDGGITSTSAQPMGTYFPTNHAEWESRMGRGEGAAYFDFLVDIPTDETDDVFLGYIGYANRRLLIFSDHYELWNYTGMTPSQDGSDYNAPGGSTAGVHNIGLIGGKVYIDGTDTGLSGSPISSLQAMVRFGTHTTGGDPAAPGIILYEQLTYVQSYNRSVLSTGPAGGGGGGGTGGIPPVGGGGDPQPRTTFTPFDTAQPVAVYEMIDDGMSGVDFNLTVDFEGDATRHAHHYNIGGTGGEKTYTMLSLPNGRRQTGVIVGDEADGTVNDEGGGLMVDPGMGLHPGVSIALKYSATGHPQASAVNDVLSLERTPNEYTGDNNVGVDLTGGYDIIDQPVGMGTGDGGITDTVSAISSSPILGIMSVTVDPEKDAPGKGLSAGGTCACRCQSANDPRSSAIYFDPYWGGTTDYINGNGFDNPTGQEFSSGYGETGGVQPLKGSWIGGFDPDDAHDGLSEDHQDILHDLWEDGWKFATKTDGSETIPGIDGPTDDINIEVKNDDWASRLAEGQDVQWEEDEWAVDFDNKVIYIDASEDDVARDILADLAEKIAANCGGISDTDFHDGKDKWAAFGDAIGAAALAGMGLGIREQRLLSQLGAMNAKIVDIVVDAFSDFYGPDAIIGGVAGAVGGALLYKLFKVIKNARKFVNIGKAGKLGKLAKGAGKKAKNREVASEGELKALWKGLSKGKDVKTETKNGKTFKYFEDSEGRRVQYRDSSKSGGATIDIHNGKMDGVSRVHIKQ